MEAQDRKRQEIESILRDFADRKSRGRTITDSAYSVLASKYYELFELNKDDMAFQEAINNITNAIKISPDRLVYYAMRAKYYMGREQNDLAKVDIDHIRPLLDPNIHIQSYDNFYIRKILSDYDNTDPNWSASDIQFVRKSLAAHNATVDKLGKSNLSVNERETVGKLKEKADEMLRMMDSSSSGGKRKKKRIMRTKRKRTKRTRRTKRH